MIRMFLDAGLHMLNPRSSAEWIVALKVKPGAGYPVKDNKTHALAAAQWLLRSQEACGDTGYSVGYSLATGWQQPFPETTGYIIPTMLKLARYNKKYERSAIKAGEWLLTQQYESGAFPYVDGTEHIFDTGQIIFGLIALYKRINDKRYLDAAMRAGDWIVKAQEKNGSFVQHTYQHGARTYYARAAWALAELWVASGKMKYRNAARKQLLWTVKQQRKDGWFENAGFFDDGRPVLHTIAYTIEALLCAGKMLGDKRIIAAGERGAKALLQVYQHDGKLVSFYKKGWKPASDQRCVTGLAQTVIIFKLMPGTEFADAIDELQLELKSYQNISTGLKNVNGAIPGSVPILGEYMRWTFPNWAAKFAIDALE